MNVVEVVKLRRNLSATHSAILAALSAAYVAAPHFEGLQLDSTAKGCVATVFLGEKASRSVQRRAASALARFAKKTRR